MYSTKASDAVWMCPSQMYNPQCFLWNFNDTFRDVNSILNQKYPTFAPYSYGEPQNHEESRLSQWNGTQDMQWDRPNPGPPPQNRRMLRPNLDNIRRRHHLNDICYPNYDENDPARYASRRSRAASGYPSRRRNGWQPRRFDEPKVKDTGNESQEPVKRNDHTTGNTMNTEKEETQSSVKETPLLASVDRYSNNIEVKLQTDVTCHKSNDETKSPEKKTENAVEVSESVHTNKIIMEQQSDNSQKVQLLDSTVNTLGQAHPEKLILEQQSDDNSQKVQLLESTAKASGQAHPNKLISEQQSDDNSQKVQLLESSVKTLSQAEAFKVKQEIIVIEDDNCDWDNVSNNTTAEISADQIETIDISDDESKMQNDTDSDIIYLGDTNLPSIKCNPCHSLINIPLISMKEINCSEDKSTHSDTKQEECVTIKSSSIVEDQVINSNRKKQYYSNVTYDKDITVTSMDTDSSDEGLVICESDMSLETIPSLEQSESQTQTHHYPKTDESKGETNVLPQYGCDIENICQRTKHNLAKLSKTELPSTDSLCCHIILPKIKNVNTDDKKLNFLNLLKIWRSHNTSQPSVSTDLIREKTVRQNHNTDEDSDDSISKIKRRCRGKCKIYDSDDSQDNEDITPVRRRRSRSKSLSHTTLQKLEATSKSRTVSANCLESTDLGESKLEIAPQELNITNELKEKKMHEGIDHRGSFRDNSKQNLLNKAIKMDVPETNSTVCPKIPSAIAKDKSDSRFDVNPKKTNVVETLQSNVTLEKTAELDIFGKTNGTCEETNKMDVTVQKISGEVSAVKANVNEEVCATIPVVLLDDCYRSGKLKIGENCLTKKRVIKTAVKDMRKLVVLVEKLTNKSGTNKSKRKLSEDRTVSGLVEINRNDSISNKLCQLFGDTLDDVEPTIDTKRRKIQENKRARNNCDVKEIKHPHTNNSSKEGTKEKRSHRSAERNHSNRIMSKLDDHLPKGLCVSESDKREKMLKQKGELKFASKPSIDDETKKNDSRKLVKERRSSATLEICEPEEKRNSKITQRRKTLGDTELSRRLDLKTSKYCELKELLFEDLAVMTEIKAIAPDYKLVREEIDTFSKYEEIARADVVEPFIDLTNAVEDIDDVNRKMNVQIINVALPLNGANVKNEDMQIDHIGNETVVMTVDNEIRSSQPDVLAKTGDSQPLSSMVIEGREEFQLPPLQKIFPGKTGPNRSRNKSVSTPTVQCPNSDTIEVPNSNGVQFGQPPVLNDIEMRNSLEFAVRGTVILLQAYHMFLTTLHQIPALLGPLLGKLPNPLIDVDKELRAMQDRERVVRKNDYSLLLLNVLTRYLRQEQCPLIFCKYVLGIFPKDPARPTSLSSIILTLHDLIHHHGESYNTPVLGFFKDKCDNLASRVKQHSDFRITQTQMNKLREQVTLYTQINGKQQQLIVRSQVEPGANNVARARPNYLVQPNILSPTLDVNQTVPNPTIDHSGYGTNQLTGHTCNFRTNTHVNSIGRTLDNLQISTPTSSRMVANDYIHTHNLPNATPTKNVNTPILSNILNNPIESNINHAQYTPIATLPTNVYNTPVRVGANTSALKQLRKFTSKDLPLAGSTQHTHLRYNLREDRFENISPEIPPVHQRHQIPTQTVPNSNVQTVQYPVFMANHVSQQRNVPNVVRPNPTQPHLVDTCMAGTSYAQPKPQTAEPSVTNFKIRLPLAVPRNESNSDNVVAKAPNFNIPPSVHGKTRTGKRKLAVAPSPNSKGAACSNKKIERKNAPALESNKHSSDQSARNGGSEGKYLVFFKPNTNNLSPADKSILINSNVVVAVAQREVPNTNLANMRDKSKSPPRNLEVVVEKNERTIGQAPQLFIPNSSTEIGKIQSGKGKDMPVLTLIPNPSADIGVIRSDKRKDLPSLAVNTNSSPFENIEGKDLPFTSTHNKGKYPLNANSSPEIDVIVLNEETPSNSMSVNEFEEETATNTHPIETETPQTDQMEFKNISQTKITGDGVVLQIPNASKVANLDESLQTLLNMFEASTPKMTIKNESPPASTKIAVKQPTYSSEVIDLTEKEQAAKTETANRSEDAQVDATVPSDSDSPEDVIFVDCSYVGTSRKRDNIPDVKHESTTDVKASPKDVKPSPKDVKPSTSALCAIEASLALIGDIHHEKILQDYDSVDITWIDDVEPEEVERNLIFLSIKKDEPIDVDEPEPDRLLDDHLGDALSPADSGIASPPLPQEIYNNYIYPDQLCICDEPATYVCTFCNSVMYCSPKCQLQDWCRHRKLCSMP